MGAPFLFAELDPRFAGWIMLATGLGTLVWAGLDYLRGETWIGDDSGFVTRIIRRDQEPVSFRRTIILVVFAGVVCLAGAGFLLL